MNNGNGPSNLFGPDGQPLDALRVTTAKIGGQSLEYFVTPGMARTVNIDLSRPVVGPAGLPACFEDKVQGGFNVLSGMVASHELSIHSMLREIVKLRERIAVLEACETEPEILP